MQRAMTALGSLAVAGMTMLALPGSAAAATGELILGGGQVVENPSGCVNAEHLPLDVHNQTDGIAYVYGGRDCTGSVLAILAPGSSAVSAFGVSVYVA